jgi:3-hydroxyisobutyrate dehydrogenase-like beta-hydroxyacid dehydrogenase
VDQRTGAQRIGFIGVGMMGHGMASNLLAKGFALTIKGNRNRAPVEDLKARGAREAPSARALAESSAIVFLCVGTSPQVEGLMRGPEGILAGARPGLIVIDASTSDPASTDTLREEAAAAGVTFVDAPLTRTPVEAAAGRLNALVGATPEALEAIRPALAAFCENIIHIGPPGSGHRAKLINNFLALGLTGLFSEAFVACERTGVDLEKFYRVIAAGGVNSGIFQMIWPKAMAGDYTGQKFMLALARKDLGYYCRMADEAGVAALIGDLLHNLFIQAGHLGYDDGMVGSLIAMQRRLHGRTEA